MVLHQQLHKQRTNYQRQISRCNSNRMEYKIVAVKAPGTDRPAQHGKYQGTEKIQDDTVTENPQKPLSFLPGQIKNIKKAESCRQINRPASCIAENHQQGEKYCNKPRVRKEQLLPGRLLFP